MKFKNLVAKYWWIPLVILVVICLGIGCSLMVMLFGKDTNHFGAEHPIPEGLEYSLPDEKEIIPDINDANTWILLQEGIQPGIYYYTISLPELTAGTVYVDAFEVTSNYHLLFQDGHDNIEKSIRGHYRFGTVLEGEAFLYDGVWGEPYAVRIEVAFKPLGSVGAIEYHPEKQIITSKVYKLEGWQR